MYRTLLVVLLGMVLFPLNAGAQTDTVTILHMNDTHANLAPLGPRTEALEGTIGGIARAATVIGMTKMETPEALVLHAGDISIGDLFYTQYFAVAELQLLLGMGVDAMTAGNHEFDLGPFSFQQMLDTAFAAGGFPILSANAIMDDPTLVGLRKHITPYTISNAGSTKVGVFGLTTPTTNLLSQPTPVVLDEDFPGVAAAMVDTLTALGCKVIVCLSHLGAGYDQMLAATVPGIHLIVGGHDHYAFTEPIAAVNPANDTTWIVQAESFYKAMGKVRFVADGSTVRLLDYTYIPLDVNIPEEPTTAGIIAGLISGIEGTYGSLYTQRIGYVAEDFDEVADSLTKPGWKDTPIGNLVADAYRAALETQIGIQAGGSTAHPLWHGPIVGADVFRVVGYGFNADNGLGYHLATFRMTGAALMAGLEFGVSEIENGDEYLLQVSGMTYSYDPAKPVSRRVWGVTIGGQPVDPGATYTVAANEFIPLFLTAMEIPFSDLVVFSGDTTEFQVLLQAVMVADTLTPHTEGRVKAATYIDPGTAVADGASPTSFLLTQNYPNPFNPSTLISFSLPVTSDVRLIVFDILGRTVTTLLSGQCRSGNTEVSWNGRDLSGAQVASGVYFYRLEARPSDGSTGFTAIRKMLLTK